MKNITLFLMLFIAVNSYAQSNLKTENVIVITFDGLRWQELYNGADSVLINDSGYVHNPEDLVKQFWKKDKTERRAELMPFFSKIINEKGQLYGNRKYNNLVNCTNNHWFSYPGYNEILSGFSDDERIHSNDKIQNPNKTVLEFINDQDAFNGKVAAFGYWDVFPYIINEERSGIPVNAGFESATGNDLSEREILLNQLQKEIRSPWGGVRLDAFTHHYAMEYIKKNNPRVVYIAYGETDDYAHDGRYDDYLKSAFQTDQYIKEIWDYVQSNQQYKDKTTLVITTDHGRGTMPLSTWKHHGTKIENAGQIWIAAIGPDTEGLGVIKTGEQLYQNQIAATVAALLGLNYENDKQVGKPIQSIYKSTSLTNR